MLLSRNQGGGPRRNRVLPTGQIVADDARGTFTGNRGILVDRTGKMTHRQWTAKAWITCLLDFRGRQRPIAQPRTWTELFFLDEAVALAAGHRPCAYCRRADYTHFKALWGGAKATQIDTDLHMQRLDGRAKRLHPVVLEDLPDGAFVVIQDVPYLIRGAQIFPYASNGYTAPQPRPDGAALALTPPGTLEVLRAGYTAQIHPSADARAD